MNVDPRPLLTPALEALLVDVVARVPELAGIACGDIVVVALGAHAHSAASVRALGDVAHSVHVDGKKRRVELGLRPPWFHGGDAPRRLATLVHELLHLDPHAPGRLLEANRHKNRSHAKLEKEARAIAVRYLDAGDPTLVLCLAHEGEVLMRQWRHRPFDTTAKTRFTDDDVFHGPVRMITPSGARGGWW